MNVVRRLRRFDLGWLCAAWFVIGVTAAVILGVFSLAALVSGHRGVVDTVWQWYVLLAILLPVAVGLAGFSLVLVAAGVISVLQLLAVPVRVAYRAVRHRPPLIGESPYGRGGNPWDITS